MDDELPSLMEFINTHPTEDDCWHYLREKRWGEDGFECPDCGETEHWGFIEPRNLFECYECRKQTSITAGTILQDTKLDLKTWFLAIYHVIKTKKGITEPELARTLGVHAETAHNVRQKVYRILRRANHQSRSLEGVVEADETYVGGKRPDDPSGRGTSKQCVVALVENKDDEAGNLHLQCVPGAGGDNLAPTVRAHVQEGATLWTDDWAGYNALEGYDREVRQPAPDEEMHDVLPWSHTVFSNLKRVLYGVHAYVEDWNVQPYLDAFSFRVNHRAFLGRGLEKALRGIVETPPRPNDRLKRSGQLGVAT